MTVNTLNITSGPFAGNGVADSFAYTFRIEDKTEVTVFETDDNNVQTTLVVDTDYTVAGIGIDGGGTITRVAGALPTDFEWFIRSNYIETQDTDFDSQGGFFPEVHEKALDKLTFLIQQIIDKQSRAPVVSDAYTGPLPLIMPDPIAGKIIRWLGDLSGFENIDVSDLSPGLVADDRVVFAFATLAEAIASTDTNIMKIGAPLKMEERTASHGGGAIWYAVDASTVIISPEAPGAGNIVQCVGVPGLALVLEDTKFPGATAIEINHNVKQWGAHGDQVNEDNIAVQAIFDSFVQYSTDTQNSGSFQTPVTMFFPDGDYLFKNGVTKSYRNNMNIIGTGKIWADSTFTDDHMFDLIACSHMIIKGLFFEGDSHKANSAIRVSGDGLTGVGKKNSTNVKFINLFFHDIGATGTNQYVVDTLSPEGVSGDFSLDDSEFTGCIWLGSFGGALRLASSEIKIYGGKMSAVGVDGVNPMISMGNGSSLVANGLVWTASTGKIIEGITGASVGRVLLDGCYSESTNKPVYSQSGGTCRGLTINGGYYAGLDDSDADFVLFNNACKAQLEMHGVTFQTNGYTTIDLGDAGSYIGDAQTSTTSFKSFYPRIKNGAFSERKFAIQTTQDGDRKRFIDAKYEQLNDTKLQLFVGVIDDFTRLRFLTLKDALRYVDQSGYTECEVQIFAGTHVIDEPFTFSGDLTIQGDGAATTTIDIQSFITVRNGRFAIASATVNYINRAIINKGSYVTMLSTILTAASDSIFLVNHFNGDTIFSSCEFKTAGSGVSINNNYRSTGTVSYFNNTFTNTNAKASDASTSMCRTKHIGTSIPTTGFWQRGSLSEADEVNSGAQLQEINTVAGSPGTWRGTIKADAT